MDTASLSSPGHSEALGHQHRASGISQAPLCLQAPTCSLEEEKYSWKEGNS